MTQEVKQRRIQCNYQPENARFLLDCDFSKQYDRYYRKRLDKTRPFIEYNCRSKWDPNIPIYNLAEVANFSSTNEPLDPSDVGSAQFSPGFSSPESPGGTGIQGNYKFEKRIRKFSQSDTPGAVGGPQTSTQSNKAADELMFSDDDDDRLELASPIVGAQRMLPRSSSVSPSVRKPAGSDAAKCIVIGTIFKRMKLQPDVVDELSRGDFHVKCERYLGHYTSQDDTLVLEDNEESIQLVGNIEPRRFVTGIVVGLLGVSIDDGSQFMVFDVCFAEPNRELLYDDDHDDHNGAAQLQPSTSSPPEAGRLFSAPHVERPAGARKPCYLLVVSDLGFHHEMDKKVGLTRALQDMIDFIWGGAKYSDDPRSSQVARILVAGNSLHDDRFLEEHEDEEAQLAARAAAQGQDEIMLKMKQSRQVKQYAKSMQAAKHMDDFFAQLSKTIHVDIMPGPSDPASHLMPQQPFHPCMFPQSSLFATFNCTTNPHHAIYNDTVEIFTTAGQNVDIIRKFSGLIEAIDIMKCHLMWGNSAPSAPDNLYSVPYEDDDPFVIDFIPDVYIAGGQGEFKIDYYHYDASMAGASARSSQANSSLQSGSHLLFDTSQTRSPAARTTTPRRKDAGNAKPSGTPKLGSLDSAAGSRRGQHDESLGGAAGAPLDGAPGGSRKRRTLLVTVPKFFETFSCVLLDLVTLEAQLLTFK